MSAPPRRPGSLPLVGHLPYFLRDKLGFLVDCARGYGDVVELNLGGPTFLVTHPGDVAHILVDNAPNFTRSPRLSSERGRRVGGLSLITSEGEDHQRLRRGLLPAMRQSSLESLAPVILARAAAMAEGWQDGEVVDMCAAMRSLARECAARTMLGEPAVDRHPEIVEAIETRRQYMLAYYGSLRPYPERWPISLNRRFQKAKAMVERTVEECMSDDNGPPSLLTELCRAAPWGKGNVSRAEMQGQLFTLLVSSYETLADLLAWMWWALGNEPEVEAAIAADLKARLNRGGSLSRELMSLDYTAKFVAEVLRVYPPTWMFVRMAITADRLPSGASLPAGVKIYLSQWVTHRDPRWFSEPQRFNPARFDTENARTRPPFAYFPFGGGVRLCIGEALAKMTAYLTLAAVFGRARLQLVAAEPIRPLPSVTLTPSAPIRMRVHRV